jgi:8-oxo-dGTP pyrophosphatase MutT (NUDIX family)
VARTEYVNNPDAPPATHIVPAATAFVLNDDGAVLLIHRSDNNLWAMPGGAQEVGETIATTAERETLEETGYQVRVTGLVGIYSDPHHVIQYDDGEVRQQFALTFRAVLESGELTLSDESPAVQWFRKGELDDIAVHESIRLRIEHGFANAATPYIG